MLNWLERYMLTETPMQMHRRVWLFTFLVAAINTGLYDQLFLKFQFAELQSVRLNTIIYTFIFTVFLSAPWAYAIGLLIRKLAKTNADLKEVADHDALTGLLNRRAFKDVVEIERRKMRRLNRDSFTQDIARKGSLIIIDLDHFKLVNDTYGHDAGDKVLQHVAAILNETSPAGATIARLGGEEFVIADIYSDDAGQLAEHIRLKIFTSHLMYQNQKIALSASAGATLLSIDEPLQHALIRADEALYAAKREGRNRIVLAKDTPSIVPSESTLASIEFSTVR